jgi:transcriptional regulator with XRE-family HTH domain
MSIGLYSGMKVSEEVKQAIARVAVRIDQAISWSGKSQDQLARETGIAQSAISAMTKGTRRPYFDQLVELARATRVSVSWLAAEDGATLGIERPPGISEFDDALIVRTFHLAKIDVHEAIDRLRGQDAVVGIPAMGPPTGKSSADEAARKAERERAANGETPKRPKPKSGN